MTGTPKLILGSGSPRRLELLAQLGLVPDDIRHPDIDEDPRKTELPRPYCNRITAQKVAAVDADPDDIVLCADTTVALGRRIMGKPSDAAEAKAFLRSLSGRRHRVITAVAIKRGARRFSSVHLARACVHFARAAQVVRAWHARARVVQRRSVAARF